MRRLWIAVLLLGTSTVVIAEDDSFAFIPEGGRTLLEALLAANPDLAGQLAEKRPAEDWLATITDDRLPGTETFDEWQARTLADYLGYTGPIDPDALPPDGRDLTLAQCQSCHIVTVVVTQARAKEAWLGTLNKPSHVGVPMPPAERDQLADYLTVNAGASPLMPSRQSCGPEAHPTEAGPCHTRTSPSGLSRDWPFWGSPCFRSGRAAFV